MCQRSHTVYRKMLRPGRQEGGYFDILSFGLVNNPRSRSQFASKTGHSLKVGSPSSRPTP